MKDLNISTANKSMVPFRAYLLSKCQAHFESMFDAKKSDADTKRAQIDASIDLVSFESELEPVLSLFMYRKCMCLRNDFSDSSMAKIHVPKHEVRLLISP